MAKIFDLNVEQVLEHWELEHAVREIIANAIDEKTLTNSRDIEIYKNDNKWYIRDFGRGIQDFHFTQNENKEKLDSPHLIGKFGVGLKDALAVFYRKGIEVEINSKYASVTLSMSNKSGFNIETLHAVFNETKDCNMIGSEFIIAGIDDDSISKAKNMFLIFNKEITFAEKTRYGEVYFTDNSIPSIYINGVKVASEENFLYSYNITNVNAQIKKALNRERSNVGRTAYSDSVKNILLKCISDDVLLKLINDLENIMYGSNKDETSWVDVATYATKELNKKGDFVFMTPMKRAELSNNEVEILEQSGKRLIMITENVFNKVENAVTTYDVVYKEYNDSYEYSFVEYNELSNKEKEVYDMKNNIISFLKSNNYKCNATIKISSSIQVNQFGYETQGLCDRTQNIIIIKRSVLQNEQDFYGVLIHEFAHFYSGFDDNTREFENVLTELLGKLFYYNTHHTNEKITSKFNLFSFLKNK